MNRLPLYLSIAVSLLLNSPAEAHQGTISDGTAIDAEHAIEFVDPQISRVVYHEVTAAAPQLWITFEIDSPQSLRIQLGVPYIDNLVDFRPVLALLGPELPEVELPFDIPEHLGAQLYTADDQSDPEVFFEPFTGTSSWMLIETDVQLPAAGKYYLVAYVPSEETGKLWVATGVKEVFSAEDIANLSDTITDVRAFHEVGPDAAPPCFLVTLLAGLTAFLGFRSLRRS